ncbi:LuxR family quorum sensing-dependent transcriptional regulator [Microvirga flocculans]|uniref:LuxR family quorum sensing-dependent transcriptional regulator n=1 Tax=Microvirga flocculans TaxID=217168 RepID=A0A7W6ID69_9HYPH|nr:LuxR family transcriptional regulator [Microvirga flocculans]MBB4038966.1 LuxR family quorum sensing-dependent transcriptional regulator [Microvirga flocculans]
MSGRRLDHTAEAFEFIEDLDRLTTPQDIIDAMERSFARFGFENFIMTGLPHPDQRIESLVLLKKWPIDWYRRYTHNGYDRHDPIIRLCRQTVQPFEWSEARYDPETNPKGAEIMREAEEFGMRQGYCLPIHGLNGFEACLSMSGSALELTPQTKPALHLMTMYAFERARLILAPSPRPNPLTAREQESLRWAALGKSAADTGEILGVTERTITAHISSACIKLNAANKTHAVARALHHRLIEM